MVEVARVIVFSVLVVGLPIYVFLVMKFGTYGYFCGRELFNERNKKENEDGGTR